jgi:hypothetical protein
VEPVAVTVDRTAAATSTRPAPAAYASSPLSLCEVLISASLSRAGGQSGCCWASSAAAPATCGEAIEVPSSSVYQPVSAVPPALAARMPTPGALMSGLRA